MASPKYFDHHEWLTLHGLLWSAADRRWLVRHGSTRSDRKNSSVHCEKSSRRLYGARRKQRQLFFDSDQHTRRNWSERRLLWNVGQKHLSRPRLLQLRP